MGSPFYKIIPKDFVFELYALSRSACISAYREGTQCCTSFLVYWPTGACVHGAPVEGVQSSLEENTLPSVPFLGSNNMSTEGKEEFFVSREKLALVTAHDTHRRLEELFEVRIAVSKSGQKEGEWLTVTGKGESPRQAKVRRLK